MGGRGEGRDGVSWGHRFTVGADDIVWEMREGRRNGKRGSESLGLDFPVFVQLVVLVDGRGVFRDRRGRKVEESGKGDGWGGSERGQDFGDGGGEHSAPVSNHCPVSSGNAKSSLVVVSEVVGAFLVILPGVFHDITPDLFLGEGGRRHLSSSGLSSATTLLNEAVH